MFELVAHRGYPGHYPENSLVGMRAALEAGARYVEFDVQFTRDGVPVVLHDASLLRVTEQHRMVYHVDWSELAAMVAGEPARFGDRFRDERIPHLDTMLALIGEFPGVTAFIEVKPASLREIGHQRALRALQPILDQRREWAVVLSFDARLLEMAKEDYRTGWAFSPWKAHLLAEAERLAPEFLFTGLRGLPPGREAFWKGPWSWAVYEVPDLPEAEMLSSLGAHLIETDFIGEWLQHKMTDEVY